MIMNKLFGDGIHDDYPAIQEMIDSGAHEVILPDPQECYLISKTLVLPSDFRLVLPRFAEIRLMDQANCPMIRNTWNTSRGHFSYNSYNSEINRIDLWNYSEQISTLPEDTCHDFEVIGGIWNFNNKNQKPNPILSGDFDGGAYTGFGMQFFNVTNFRISSLTLKDPVNFAITIDAASFFTVSDITFDYNSGNPAAINMDGIHINGNCHHAHLRNLMGACYDDVVALNAFEGFSGPISNIYIDGIFAENCHSAVRLLAVFEEISNIHISDIYGTYYQYCIGFTRYYETEHPTGIMKTIDIRNVYASKASRDGIYPYPDTYVYPLIYFESRLVVTDVSIDCLCRREKVIPVETISVEKGAVIENMRLSRIIEENLTGKDFSFLTNYGIIQRLVQKDIRLGDNYPADSVTEDQMRK